MRKVRLVLCFILIIQVVEGLRYNFYKLSCNTSDPTQAIFEKCLLKPVARNHQFVSIKAKGFNKPVKDAKVRLRVMKRANGWKPFLYDITLGCKFLNKINPLTKLLWATAKDITNINHSCPFYEDLEVYKLENTYVSSKILRDLPVPAGEYAVFWKVTADNKYSLFVNLYGIVSQSS